MQRLRPGVVYLLLIMMLLGTLWEHPTTAMAAPAAQTRTAAFQSAPCPFTALGLVEGENVECGYVTVPEEHSNPDGPTIRLAVAILESQDSNPAPDPLFLAQGGPGGSTIDTYTQILPTSDILPSNRDIVLFDQRGTLYSEPNLLCTEVFDLTIETLDQILSDEESSQRSIAAMLECRDRLDSEGVNVAAYDSLENAADIEALRIALGYEQINLYGVSYGTLLALHTMRDYPESLRSVILDAVVPPQVNFLIESPQSEDRAFTIFFEACAADPACNSAYPNLEQVFFEQVDRLNETPAQIQLTDSEMMTTYDAILDGDTLRSALFQLLYASEIIPLLPKVIYDAHDGTYNVLERLLALLVFDRTISYGMYYSVICAEDADFTPDDMQVAGIRPVIAEDAEREATDLLAICAQWGADPLAPAIDEPVVSDIPTLVLSGNLDPITPPRYGEIAAETLSQSYVYTFPSGGHGAAFSGGCSDQIITAFLDNPTVEPDAACVDDQPLPDFLVPADVLVLPSILGLLNLEGNAASELSIFGLFLLLLLSVILVWPILWIIRLARKRERGPSPILLRLAPWLAALNGILILAFIVGLVGVTIALALANETVVLFGLPREWAGLFILPILSGILTLVMLASSAQSWVTTGWTIWRRSYYTLLTLAALGCMLILFIWGVFGVFFG